MITVPRLMLVTDRHRTRGRDLASTIAAAARGGLSCVVVRERDLDEAQYGALVERIRAAVPGPTTIVVHGHRSIARDLGLGLHLPAGAPALGGGRTPGLYGRSVHDDDELRCAVEDGVDYVIVGTIFETQAKPGVRPAGLTLIERLHRQAPKLPLLAIGGLTVSRIPAVIHAGAHGAAVCGALLSAADPERVAQGMDLALNVATQVRSR